MNRPQSYSIGDNLFSIDISPELLSEKELANYAPFRAVRCEDGGEPMFSFKASGCDIFTDACAEITSFTDENGRMALFATPSCDLCVKLSTPSGDECCTMIISRDYRTATACIKGTLSERHYALDTSLMLLYAFASSTRHMLLIHASAVEYEGAGYLFLGKSGTGKSTHSRLWTEHIPGARLLNDDNPVIGIRNGQVMVYGSPWSGKTSCYIDRSIPLGALVRLHQSPRNHITALSGVRSYAAVLPSCSYMKWNPVMAAAVHDSVSRLVGCVPVFDLECRPDREAAVLCHETITRK